MMAAASRTGSSPHNSNNSQSSRLPPFVRAYTVGLPLVSWRHRDEEVIADGTAKFDQEFREGAVRIVRETGNPIAQVALGGWP
jgi:hypothetical protein